jgi:hypothetical protein
MPGGIRRLLVAGVLFTLAGLLGLGLTLSGDTSATLRWLFVISYAIGALLLVAGGLWWAIGWTKRRD